MNRFTAESLGPTGLQLVTRQRLQDSRGFLSRLFCSEELREIGWLQPIAQINHTHTVLRGTVRGLHFQHPPSAEMKLVSCIRGTVWDVAVDLRRGSATFLSWRAAELSATNGRSLLIPEGYAHGFQSLSDDAELLYCHSAAYAPSSEAGLNPGDPVLGIEWPLPTSVISPRDAQHPFLDSNFNGIDL